MALQVKGSNVPPAAFTRVSRPATGSKLFDLVQALRRKGYTASFGVDIDPKLKR